MLVDLDEGRQGGIEVGQVVLPDILHFKEGKLDTCLTIGQVDQPQVLNCCACECPLYILRVDRHLIGLLEERYDAVLRVGLGVDNVRRRHVLAISVDRIARQVGLKRSLCRHVVSKLGKRHLLDDCDYSWPSQEPRLRAIDFDRQVCDERGHVCEVSQTELDSVVYDCSDLGFSEARAVICELPSCIWVASFDYLWHQVA